MKERRREQSQKHNSYKNSSKQMILQRKQLEYLWFFYTLIFNWHFPVALPCRTFKQKNIKHLSFNSSMNFISFYGEVTWKLFFGKPKTRGHQYITGCTSKTNNVSSPVIQTFKLWLVVLICGGDDAGEKFF